MSEKSERIWAMIDRIVYSFLFAAIFIAICVTFVYASEPEKTAAPEKCAWSASLGAGAATTPEFEGSDKYKTRMTPHISVEFMERVFVSTDKGLGVYFVKGPEWTAGVAANYNLGRKEKDSELLRGMGDIDGGVTLGAFAAWTPAPFIIALEADQGTGDVQGLRATLSLGHEMPLFDCLQWQNTVSTTFADSRYNDTFFGISSKQSRDSRKRYEEYNPGSGIKDISFTSGLSWAITDNISTMLSGQYTRLTGPAADSPLVKAGSKNQGTGMLGLVYTLGD